MKFLKVFTPMFLIFTIITSIIQPAISNSENVADKIFRLHIIANSDSSEDQEIKLRLRDYILISTSDLFTADSLDENITLAKLNSEKIEQGCRKYLDSIGCKNDIKISVVKEFFKTRVYDDFTLPAGMYNSLKVEIGEAEGHNWWCIIFPTVCLSGCSKSMSDYLEGEEMELITSEYTPKFKIIEIYEKIKSRKFINN